MVSNNDKLEILETLNTFKALSNKVDNNAQKPQTNFETILENNENLIVFLLALTTLLLGTEGLILLVGNVLKSSITKFETKLKERLKKEFQKGKNNNVSVDQTPLATSGVTFDRSDIDKENSLKNKAPRKESFFRQKLREATQTGAIVSITDKFSVQYDENSDKFIFTTISAVKIFEFLTEDLLELIQLDPNSILEQILDAIFGINSKTKSINTIQNDLERQLFIDLILDNKEKTFTKFDFEKITKEAKIRKQGNLQLDLNCSLVGFGLNETNTEVLLDKDFDSLTNEELGQAVFDLLGDGLNEAGLNNDENLKDFLSNNFFKRIINVLLSQLLSPEYITVLALFKTLNNQDFENIINTNYQDDLQGDLVDCIVEDLKETLYEEIYDLIKSEIITLVRSVIEVFLKEQAENYLAILKSLIRL